MLLRQLSVLYLAAASSFVVAIMLSQHPMLNSAAKVSAQFVGHTTAEAAVALNDDVIQPGWKWSLGEAGDLAHRAELAMNPPPVQVAQKPAVAPHAAKPTRFARHEASKPVKFARAKPKVTVTTLAAVQPQKSVTPPSLRPAITETKPAPTIAPAPDTSQQVASAAPPKITLVPQSPRDVAPTPSVESAPPPPSVSAQPPSPEELVRVEQRLKDSLTSEMLDHFALFLYVSKAEHGPLAQRMYVFQKDASGDLTLLYNWPVSTGREQIEYNSAGTKLPSFTPAGYYELDPGRMYSHYHSMQWDQPMPYAMFFNWEDHGYQTGLAIHGASGEDIGLLGTRASAGCVRLAPENARVLFSLIRQNYKGLVPKFAYDRKTATMANNGMLLHDTDGRLQLAQGYKVLVFIENYSGENVVAALF
jgi:lipoprotein-anchoring transpeptidase ErfK/SrfK